MVMIKYEFTKEKENKINFEFNGSLTDMCDGVINLIENILLNYADKHPTESKEYIADIVKRKLIYDMSNMIDDKYNMDDLFERTILESDEI